VEQLQFWIMSEALVKVSKAQSSLTFLSETRVFIRSSTLCEELFSMVGNERACDCEILLNDNSKIFCHAWMLSRFPVLETTLKFPVEPPEKAILDLRHTKLTKELILWMLHYIYLGEITTVEPSKGQIYSQAELYDAAKQIGVDDERFYRMFLSEHYLKSIGENIRDFLQSKYVSSNSKPFFGVQVILASKSVHIPTVCLISDFDQHFRVFSCEVLCSMQC
jgi:hypothetical protein